MKITLKKRSEINPNAGKIHGLFPKKKIEGKTYKGFETTFVSRPAAEEVSDHLRNRGYSVRIIKTNSRWEVFYRKG
jgi:hypothetical protein